jgi:hypothetical protein
MCRIRSEQSIRLMVIAVSPRQDVVPQFYQPTGAVGDVIFYAARETMPNGAWLTLATPGSSGIQFGIVACVPPPQLDRQE